MIWLAAAITCCTIAGAPAGAVTVPSALSVAVALASLAVPVVPLTGVVPGTPVVPVVPVVPVPVARATA